MARAPPYPATEGVASSSSLDVSAARSYRPVVNQRVLYRETKMTATKSSTKPFIIGLIVGVVVGLWIGVNIGKHQPIWGNPFADIEVGKQIRQESGKILEKSGRILEKKGEKLKQ